MRYILFFATLSFFLSCNSECACKLGAENVEVIQSVYGEFAAGNVDGATANFSADIEWNEAENFPYADKNPYMGPDAVVQGVFARLGGEWNGFTVGEPNVMPVGANHVLATGRYTGEYKASGQSINAQFAHLWGLSEGKVTSFQQYTDTKQVADAIAVITEEIEE